MKRILVVVLIIVSVVFSSCSKAKAPEGSSVDGGIVQNKSQAIDFELPDINGKNVKLSELKGKTVVLNFFTTWCSYCKQELPGFISLQREYKDKDVVFLFVDLTESKDTVLNFVNSMGYKDMIPLLDIKGDVSGKYNIRGVPTTYIVDKEGNVSFYNSGYVDEGQLKSAIDQAQK